MNIKTVIKAINKANFVYVCGNGGSAATAEHLTNDLFSKGIKAICLNSNTSIMTMIANDVGYEYTFSYQLDLYGEKGDLLITISASGTSPNIVKVKEVADNNKISHIEFPTFGKDRNYENIEDKHMELVHQIKKLL